jgi:hypothetical protein
MDQTGASAWRLRPAILAVVGAVAAIACAIVAGSVAWWSGGSAFSDLFEWQSASLILAIVVAAPLFQTARDAGRARFGYAKVHGHAWTDVVLWFAGWAFAGTVFAMAWLLASLFELIGSTRCPTCWRRGGSPSGWWAPRLVCSASAIPSSGRCSGLLRPCSACSRRCWARQGWAAYAGVANLRLAFGVSAIALFLALPIVSFNAIPTRDQVPRLESGRVAPMEFDWAALALISERRGRRR